MIKWRITKVVELTVILIFAIIIGFFALIAILSTLGIDPSWPYPMK